MNVSSGGRTIFRIAMALLLSAGFAFGQEAARIVISELPGNVRILTDQAGRTLYASTADEEGVSNCTGECAEVWQPLLSTGRPIVGPGLIPGMIGSLEREEGSQVTFFGHPLYYYAEDQEPGDVLGQGVNDSWYVVGFMGELHQDELALAAVDGEAVEYVISEEVFETGQTIYQQMCAACHGANGGGGGGGPGLAQGTNIGNDSYVLSQIIHGGAEMPSFGNVLSDEEVAAVATYVRNAFGNAEPPLTAEDAAAIR